MGACSTPTPQATRRITWNTPWARFRNIWRSTSADRTTGDAALPARLSPCIALDPCRKRLHVFCEEFASRAVRQPAGFVEQFVCTADIGFGHLQRRHVEEDQRLTQMMVGAECADRARRHADDSCRLLVP